MHLSTIFVVLTLLILSTAHVRAVEDVTQWPYSSPFAHPEPLITFNWEWENSICGRIAYGTRNMNYFNSASATAGTDTFKFYRINNDNSVDPTPFILTRVRTYDSPYNPEFTTLLMSSDSRLNGPCADVYEWLIYTDRVDIPPGRYHIMHRDENTPTHAYLYQDVNLTSPLDVSRERIYVRSPMPNTYLPAQEGGLRSTFSFSGPGRSLMPTDKIPITIRVTNSTYTCTYTVSGDTFYKFNILLPMSPELVDTGLGMTDRASTNCTLEYATYDFEYMWSAPLVYDLSVAIEMPSTFIPGVTISYAGSPPALRPGSYEDLGTIVPQQYLPSNGGRTRAQAVIIDERIVTIVDTTLYSFNIHDLNDYQSAPLHTIPEFNDIGMFRISHVANYIVLLFFRPNPPYGRMFAVFDKTTLTYDAVATGQIMSDMTGVVDQLSSTSYYPNIDVRMSNIGDKMLIIISSTMYLWGVRSGQVRVLATRPWDGQGCGLFDPIISTSHGVYCSQGNVINRLNTTSLATVVVYRPDLPATGVYQYTHMTELGGRVYVRVFKTANRDPIAPSSSVYGWAGLIFNATFGLVERYDFGPYPALRGSAQPLSSSKGLFGVEGLGRIVELDFNGYPGEIDHTFRQLPTVVQPSPTIRFTDTTPGRYVTILNDTLIMVENGNDGTTASAYIQYIPFRREAYPTVVRAPTPETEGDADSLPIYALLPGFPEPNSTRIVFSGDDGSVFVYAVPDDAVLSGSIGDLVQAQLLDYINRTIAEGGVLSFNHRDPKAHGMHLQGMSEQALGDLSQVTYAPLQQGRYNVTLRYVDGTTGVVVVATVNGVTIATVNSEGTSATCSDRGVRTTGLCNCNVGAYGPTCADTIESCSRTICKYDTTGMLCTVTNNGIFYCQPSSCGVNYVMNITSGQCVCAPGRTGLNCADLVACSGYGTISGGGCTCTGGRYGPLCDLTLTECNAQICGAGMVCSGTTSGVTRCLPSSETLQPCEPCTGLVHAVCDSSIGVCRCAEGYYGPTCSNSLSTCVATHCSQNGYTCRPNRKVGDSVCMTNATASDSPTYVRTGCNNNGVTLSNTTACTCFDGFYGVGCNQTLSACSTQHCTGGQVCVSTVTGTVTCGEAAASGSSWMSKKKFIWVAAVIGGSAVVLGAIVGMLMMMMNGPWHRVSDNPGKN